MGAAELIDLFIVLPMRGIDIAGKLNRGEAIADADLELKEDFDAVLARLKAEKEKSSG